MIAKALRGWKPAGLLRYLFGPGLHEEHRNPHVVASWDGAPWLHQPAKLAPVVLGDEVLEPGEFDFNLGPLTTTMQEVADAAGLPRSNPPPLSPEWEDRVRAGDVPSGAVTAAAAGMPWWVRHYRYDPKKDAVVPRRGYVWHCPVRLHPTDPTLTDRQWEHIAERLMKATGIHQAGCRWIAVRHADDHIHLMATLVSERDGKRFHPTFDWPKLRAECQQLEREFGLYRTADADWTAATQPTRAEQGKAARHGKTVTPREELRRVVGQCAASARDGAEFLADLARQGLNPQTSLGADGHIRGYSVAWPGDLTAEGTPVRFGGGKLAPDLTWPKLQARWASTPVVDPVATTEEGLVAPADRRAVLTEAIASAERAASQIRAAHEHRDETNRPDGGRHDGDVDGIIHATGEVLAALARGRDGGEPDLLSELARQYDRAARTPQRVLPTQMGAVARELRWTSRRIAAVGALSGRGHEKFTMVALLLALASLIAEISAWQETRGRVHQAAAAHAAARSLPAAAATVGSRRAPRTPRPPAPAGVGQRRRLAHLDRPHTTGSPAQRRGPRRPG